MIIFDEILIRFLTGGGEMKGNLAAWLTLKLVLILCDKDSLVSLVYSILSVSHRIKSYELNYHIAWCLLQDAQNCEFRSLKSVPSIVLCLGQLGAEFFDIGKNSDTRFLIIVACLILSKRLQRRFLYSLVNHITVLLVINQEELKYFLFRVRDIPAN